MSIHVTTTNLTTIQLSSTYVTTTDGNSMYVITVDIITIDISATHVPATVPAGVRHSHIHCRICLSIPWGNTDYLVRIE